MKTNVEKVVFWGCGGEGVYYALRYFFYLEKNCIGYDLNKTKYTEKIESLGINVNQTNPEKLKDIDLVIYSNAIPKKIVDGVMDKNKKVTFLDLGSFYSGIISEYEKGKLSSEEVKAYKKSNMAPLYNLNIKDEVFIGVTGTNGKTTTCEMLYSIFKTGGFKTCLVSTISAKIEDKQIKTGLHTTTPSGLELFKIIKKGQKEGCKYFIIETTSHGLAMKRLAGLKFDYAVFTNVTKEHLDYHKTYKNYLEAKSKLITENLKESGITILNKDDKNSFKFLKSVSKNYITYSTKQAADYKATEIYEKNNGVDFKCNSNQYELKIFGTYNVSNALACIAVSNLQNIEYKQIKNGLKNVKQVKGRMHVILNKPFKVVVDFAHTPDALLKALTWAKNNTKNNVICIFGCAGGRDVDKRKEMGKIAGSIADKVILTAEDPRYESLKDINDQIQSGFNKNNLNKIIRFDDDTKNVKVRKDAIKKGIEIAQKGDIVIICGKGHEESLNFGGKEYKWNDIDQTTKLTKNL